MPHSEKKAAKMILKNIKKLQSYNFYLPQLVKTNNSFYSIRGFSSPIITGKSDKKDMCNLFSQVSPKVQFSINHESSLSNKTIAYW